jgi:hypothetical protein
MRAKDSEIELLASAQLGKETWLGTSTTDERQGEFKETGL